MSRPSQYDAIGEKLSQGDIVANCPFGYVPSPLTIYRRESSGLPKGKANYGGTGDVPRAFQGPFELIEARATRGLGLVLWADCQIDKFLNQGKPQEKWYVGVAPVFSAKAMSQEKQDNLLEGKRRAFYPLLRFPEIGISELSYVDFRQVWAVSQNLLTERRATLSEVGRKAMYDHLLLFLTDRKVPDLV